MAEPDVDREGDAKRARDAGLYVSSKLGASLLGLVTIAIAARAYDQTRFAYIATLLLIYDTAYALGSLGLPEAVFYFVGRDRRRASIVVRQAALLLALVAAPVIAIACLVGWQLSTAEVDLVPALPWLALALACAMPAQPAINQLLAIGNARAASVLHALYAALFAAAVLAPIAIGIDITWTPVLIAGATSVRLVVHLWLLRVVYPRTASWAVRSELREMLRFAGPAGLAALCGKLNVQIDKYVVNLLLSTQVFAIYTAASWELPLVATIPYAIGAVMQVRYVELHSSGRLRELHALWTSNVARTAVVVFPIAVFAIACAPELVELLFGDAFAAAALPFQLFSAVLLHRVASYGAMLQATNQTRALLVSSVLLVGTNAVLTLPLTLLLGAPGAALATLLANVPPWLWTLSRIARAMEVRMREVMPWRQLARSLAITGALGLAVAFALRALPWPAGARLAVGAVALAAGYLIISGRRPS